MKLIPALLTISALVLPCALPAETFEGKVSMTVTSSSSKNGPQVMNFSLKEGYMRTDVDSKNGAAGIIMDFKNQQMIILMAQRQMYMVQPMNQGGMQQVVDAHHTDPAAVHSKPDLKETGVKETILGYECTKYTATTDKGTTEIWVTEQLGTFGGFPHGGGRPGGSSSQQAEQWEAALKGKSFFPLRVVTIRGGSEVNRMEVTSIQKESLPDSLFAPPPGWQKFDLGAMMGGAFPGGFPGGRPSSDGNH
jgi:hypothetical protein